MTALGKKILFGFMLVLPATWLFAQENQEVKFCVNSVGLYQGESELISALAEVIKKLGFSAEGKAGVCENQGANLWLEIKLVRVGNQTMLHITKKEGEGKVTCEKKSIQEASSPDKLLDAFSKELAVCLPPAEKKPVQQEKLKLEKPTTTKSEPVEEKPATAKSEPEVKKPVAVATGGESAANLSAVTVPAPGSESEVALVKRHPGYSSRVGLGKIFFWSGLGLGAAGTVAMIFAEREYGDIKKDLSGSETKVAALGGMGIGALTVGLTGAAVGLFLWLWPQGDNGATVSPVAFSSGGGLVFSTGW